MWSLGPHPFKIARHAITAYCIIRIASHVTSDPMRSPTLTVGRPENGAVTFTANFRNRKRWTAVNRRPWNGRRDSCGNLSVSRVRIIPKFNIDMYYNIIRTWQPKPQTTHHSLFFYTNYFAKEHSNTNNKQMPTWPIQPN